MNADPPPPPTEDPVTRAVDALRRTSSSRGPSEEILARTLAALRAEPHAPVAEPFPRRSMMIATMKIAAVILVATAGLFYLNGPPPAGPTMAFAEVAQILRNSDTLTCLVTTQIPGRKDPLLMRVLFKEPGFLRVESVPSGGPVRITDQTRNRSLALDPATKTARLEKLSIKSYGFTLNNWAERLRKLGDSKGESVGRKRIDDVQAQGFRVKENGKDATIWVDPKSRRLLHVEFKETAWARDQDQPISVEVVLSEITLGSKLDDSLFTLDPPEGYTLIEDTRQPPK